MVVKIQTVDGKIRAYQTVYGIGGGDSGPEKYVTECGMEWKNKPSPSEECDHIGCAITPAKSGADSGPMGFMVCLALAIVFLVFLSGKDIPPLEFLGFKFIGFEFLGLKFPAWSLISFGFFAFSAILSLILLVSMVLKFSPESPNIAAISVPCPTPVLAKEPKNSTKISRTFSK